MRLHAVVVIVIIIITITIAVAIVVTVTTPYPLNTVIVIKMRLRVRFQYKFYKTTETIAPDEKRSMQRVIDRKNTHKVTTKMLMTNRMLCDICAFVDAEQRTTMLHNSVRFQETELEINPKCHRFHVHIQQFNPTKERRLQNEWHRKRQRFIDRIESPVDERDAYCSWTFWLK